MTNRANLWRVRITLLLAVLILIPSGYGFVGKFVELVHVFRGEPDGAFAVAPIANYFFASVGFFLLLLWAAARGMFRDIERPKYELLEHEELLDRGLRAGWQQVRREGGQAHFAASTQQNEPVPDGFRIGSKRH
jgi:hypothetical protein